jgi:hypothetical protein
MRTLSSPTSLLPTPQIEEKLKSGERPKIPNVLEMPGPRAAGFAGLGLYVELMQRCWSQHPEERPTFHDVIDALEVIDIS